MRFLTNRQPIFVDWAITTKCYLSCRHCRYRGQKKSATEPQRYRELSKNKALLLAKDINRLNPKWILIEGGEPFLRKDLFDIIRNLKPRICTDNSKTHNSQLITQKLPVYIITSGKGFNEALAEKCRDNNVKLMISVDSGNQETYQQIRKGADYRELLNAITLAQNYQILDSINFTLQELNSSSQEINAIGQFAFLLNINKINFLGYKPNVYTVNKTSKPNFSQIFNDIQNIKERYHLNIMVDEPFYKPWLLNAKFKIPNSKFKNQGPIVVEDKSGCIFGEYLFIEPDGTLKPCSFSPLSFEEIGAETIKKIQDKKNRKGKCGKCQYQMECGGCRVRTYTLTGDWFESDPFCPL